jgi:hypothetical protein
MANVSIDGKLYDFDTLSEEVKAQLAAIQQCDQKINSWNMDIAMAQTARGAYAAELHLLLEQIAADNSEKVVLLEAEEVDEVENLSAKEIDEVEILEAEEIEANR